MKTRHHMTGRAVELERPIGFEPISPAWQTGAQPLYQGRKIGAIGQNRTVDHRFFKPALYLLSYDCNARLNRRRALTATTPSIWGEMRASNPATSGVTCRRST